MCEVCKDGAVLYKLISCMHRIEDVRDFVAEQLGIDDLAYACLDKGHYMLYSESSGAELDVYYRSI